MVDHVPQRLLAFEGCGQLAAGGVTLGFSVLSVDDLIEHLSAIKADAEGRGFGAMAYFIETALIEARLQQQQITNDQANAAADPDDLWRPQSQMGERR